MSAWVVISVYRNDLEIIGVSFNFPLFFAKVLMPFCVAWAQ